MGFVIDDRGDWKLSEGTSHDGTHVYSLFHLSTPVLVALTKEEFLQEMEHIEKMAQTVQQGPWQGV